MLTVDVESAWKELLETNDDGDEGWGWSNEISVDVFVML